MRSYTSLIKSQLFDAQMEATWGIAFYSPAFTATTQHMRQHLWRIVPDPELGTYFAKLKHGGSWRDKMWHKLKAAY